MEWLKAILLPAGIMLCLALVFGILLVFLAHKLSIEKDSKIEEIENLLAGSNCGGCGNAGCSAFAENLVKGKAKLSDCNSTSKANKEKISQIMNITGGEIEETVAVVHCNGGINCLDKYAYQGYGDCISAERLADGKKACPKGCMGLGTCVKDCPNNALTINENGVAEVIIEKCTSCGVCISRCPKKLITRIPKSAKIYVACSNDCKGKDVKSICKNGCIGCGLCFKACESGAITMVNNIPVIDYEKCIGCFKCVEKCPVGVIHKREPEPMVPREPNVPRDK